MVRKLKFYIAFLWVATISGSVMGSGIPVYSYAEMVTQRVDETKSDVGSKMVETQKELVNSALDAVGGAETFSANSFQKALKNSLIEPVAAVTGYYEGLQNLLGKGSEYGQIQIKKCGGNAAEVMKRLNETIVYPSSQVERLRMTTAELDKRAQERVRSLQNSATAGLAKAWLAQSDTSDIAEAIGKTQQELDNADSQMDVYGSFIRLQEETQKNLNTQLSLIADDVTTLGLMALEGNM